MRLLRGLLLGPVFLLCAGCPVHVGVEANGDSNNLVFEVANEWGSGRPIAVGAPVAVTVMRFDAQWETCLKMCSGTSPEPLVFKDAACDDDACTVTSTPTDDGTVSLTVTGQVASSTHLRVRVQSAHDSASWSDSVALRFVNPTRIAVRREGGHLSGSAFASLPGAETLVCPDLEAIVDGKRTSLVSSPGVFSVGLQGESVARVDDPQPTGGQLVYDQCLTLRAAKPGATTITVTSGPLSRSVTMNVADAADAVGIELRTPDCPPAATPDPPYANQDDAAPDLADSPCVSAVVPSAVLMQNVDSLSMATVLRLRDGSLALGGASLVSLDPPALADLIVDAYTPPSGASNPIGLEAASFTILAAQDYGTGHLLAQVGTDRMSVPLTIADPPTAPASSP
jgi:hypothetical protein